MQSGDTDWLGFLTGGWQEQSKLILAALVAMETCAGSTHGGKKNAIPPLSVGMVKTSTELGQRDRLGTD